MENIFGTDGVRGMANQGNMTVERVLYIGRAVAYIFQKKGRRKTASRPRIVIGKDTRLSGDMLEHALSAGITSMGADVLLCGTLPTPGVAFVARSMRADAGLVISASHNPYHDNGIKIFDGHGNKFSVEKEAKVEGLSLNRRIEHLRVVEKDIGRIRRIDDAAERYIEFCKQTIPAGLMLDGMNVVLDCANGACYTCAPPIFSELGCNVTTLHASPDGVNINDRCGSQHTEYLRAKVKELNAHAGLAFDGDGDRLIVVDENGVELTGDQFIAICARHYKEAGLLSNNRVVCTVMSNMGFHAAMQKLGIETVVADVGDRQVLEMMCRTESVLGGEHSGHIIFRNLHTTGDGIVAALQLLALMRRSGKTLSKLAGVMQIFPQVLINVKAPRKIPLSENEKLQEAIKTAEAELDGKGRILVRYSGTQPICRVMVESPAKESAQAIATRLAAIVEETADK